MYELLKTLLRWRDRDLTVMVVDPSEPVAPPEFVVLRGQAGKWAWALSSVVGVLVLLVLTLVLVRWSANGDARLRAELDEVAQRLSALSDSVEARDRHLADVRRMMVRSPSQPTSPTQREASAYQPELQRDPVQLPEKWDAPSRITTRQARASFEAEGLRRMTFPSSYPVSGQLTRTFLPEMGHFGIDIAVREGATVRNVGDGRVVSADWTVSYGYVVSVMHLDGYLLVYKHLVSTPLAPGDVVLEGETLGRAGNAGLLTSGPHLHLEIWRDGLPLDPMLYFVE